MPLDYYDQHHLIISVCCMKPQPQSMSPIRVVESFQQATPDIKYHNVFKLMGQVLDMHNSLNELRTQIGDIVKFWKASHYQLETNVATIMSTFRDLLFGKDRQIESLKQAIIELGSFREQELNKRNLRSTPDDKSKLPTQQSISKQSEGEYLSKLEMEVESIKQKLAAYDAEDASQKLMTIRQVTELGTSRERHDQQYSIKQQYERMLNRIDEAYDFRDDIEVIKNFSLTKSQVTEQPNIYSAVTGAQHSQECISEQKESDHKLSTVIDSQILVVKNIDSNVRINAEFTAKDCPQFKQARILKDFYGNPDNQDKQNKLEGTLTDFRPQSKLVETKIICSSICIEFPPPLKVTLVALTQVKPNLPSQSQSYIGNYSYTGAFDKNSQRHGYGVLKRNSKEIYVGNWKKGQFDGWGHMNLNTSKFIQYLGEFRNGSFHGRGTLLYRNGDKYVGQVQQNRVNDQGTLYRANGQSLYGLWEDNTLVRHY